jgi:hypothetical protein
MKIIHFETPPVSPTRGTQKARLDGDVKPAVERSRKLGHEAKRERKSQKPNQGKEADVGKEKERKERDKTALSA